MFSRLSRRAVDTWVRVDSSCKARVCHARARAWVRVQSVRVVRAGEGAHTWWAASNGMYLQQLRVRLLQGNLLFIQVVHVVLSVGTNGTARVRSAISQAQLLQSSTCTSGGTPLACAAASFRACVARWPATTRAAAWAGPATGADTARQASVRPETCSSREKRTLHLAACACGLCQGRCP